MPTEQSKNLKERRKRMLTFWLQNLLQHCRNWTVWYWLKDRHIDQWNRIEHPDMDLHLCGQLIFSKGIKECQLEENRLFKKCFWNNYIPTWKTNELLSLFTPCTNINSKYITDLNVRAKPHTSCRTKYRRQTLWPWDNTQKAWTINLKTDK